MDHHPRCLKVANNQEMNEIEKAEQRRADELIIHKIKGGGTHFAVGKR